MTSKHITAEGIRISFVCMILFFGRLSRTSYESFLKKFIETARNDTGGSFPTKIQLAICFPTPIN